MVTSSLNRWFLSFLLFIPVLLLYFSHYSHRAPEKIPSYFIQDDMPYYMAVAREYFDTGQTPFSYGNPFSPSPETPRHYFQPMTFILGVILNFTHFNPGLIFLGMGILTGIVGIRVAIDLFEWFQPLESFYDFLILILFIWGGGLLSLGGLCFSLWSEHNTSQWLLFDPSGGWWFLNLGRNFIYPLESLYHLLFFIGLRFCFQNRWGLALATAFLLSISHPFTGIQFLLIMTLWLVMEKSLGKIEVPLGAILASVLLMLAHLFYYLIFLTHDPEHHFLMQTWKINFSMNPITLALNLFPLGFVLWYGLRKNIYAFEWIESPENRLLLVGLLTTLALVFHNLFIPAIQPLHFDRGYLWAFLFLITLPAWGIFVESISHRSFALLLIPAIIICFLSDNVSWLTYRIQRPTGYYHTPPQKEVFDWLDNNSTSQDLLVTEEQILAYLAPTYSPVRTWYAFLWFTPSAEIKLSVQKAFFETGFIPSEWKNRSILILQSKKSPRLRSKITKYKLFENQEYQIWQIKP